MALAHRPGGGGVLAGLPAEALPGSFRRRPGIPLAAAVYAVVHAGSGNPMLVLAAAVCGLFWGYLYLRTDSVLLVAVSHTVWDLAVFVVFPFRGRPGRSRAFLGISALHNIRNERCTRMKEPS